MHTKIWLSSPLYKTYVVNYNQDTGFTTGDKQKEELHLTDMKRISIAMPSSLDEKILALRMTERFVRCSYSEIVRQLVEKGLAMLNVEQDSA